MHIVDCYDLKDLYSMKYSPVVSTLEEWLDGKLGTQGIDAVSCALYVLSLLKREEANESGAYQFPFYKTLWAQTLLSWPPPNCRSPYYLPKGGPDYSKPSTACVLVPRYKIECLGKDLSPSLKLSTSKGVAALTQGCSDKQCFSFPVDNRVERSRGFSCGGQSPNKPEKFELQEYNYTLWANERACVGYFRYKLAGGGLEGKTESFSMAAKNVHEKGPCFWKADYLFLCNGKLVWENTNESFFSWYISDETSSQDLGEAEQDPEHTQGMWEPGIFCNQVKSSAPASMPLVEMDVDDGNRKVSSDGDESNLAQLIAKFDHSLEAIWEQEDISPGSSIIEKTQNLPWSMHDTTSPSEDGQTINSSFEKNLDSSLEENSFIHSGTNLVNSIWSDQSFSRNSMSLTEPREKFKGGGIIEYNNDNCFDTSSMLKDCSKSDEKLHNKFDFLKWNCGTSDTLIDESNIKNNIYDKDVLEKSSVLWDKIQTFSSFFSNINVPEHFYQRENLQDAAFDNEQTGNSSTKSYTPCSISHLRDGCHNDVPDTGNSEKNNFSSLNHNREDSSFTEVLPRSCAGRKSPQDKIGVQFSNQTNQAAPDKSSEEGKTNVEGTSKEEEEDLLTSARTHFRPIQQEIQERRNNTTCYYADGTTFMISSNFPEVPFKRSESGTLFLENEEVTGTPKRYMEYKDKRTGDLPKFSSYISKDNLVCDSIFIPKFCVRQIEKCCQTERDESFVEINCKGKHDGVEKENKLDIFFSDDNEKNVANYLDKDNSKFSADEIECKNDYDDEKIDISAQTAENEKFSRFGGEMYVWNRDGCECSGNYDISSKNDLPRAVGTTSLGERCGEWKPGSCTSVCQPRFSIWSCSPGKQAEPCPACETMTEDKIVQHSQLREELSVDGEQLLSDLSSLQLSASWLDDALDQGSWGIEPNLQTRVSSRRRLVSWGQFGEG